MTRDEWLATYYPTPAATCPKQDAVAHSIRKWEGVAEAVENNLDIPIRVDADTCALCVHHYEPDKLEELPCETCPLANSLGHQCDAADDDDDEADMSPWYEWTNNHNPYPMLEALRAIKS